MSDIETRVIKLVAKHLDLDPTKVRREASFAADLGADSLDQVELLMSLEEEFGIEISTASAESIVKVEDAISFIENQLKNAA